MVGGVASKSECGVEDVWGDDEGRRKEEVRRGYRACARTVDVVSVRGPKRDRRRRQLLAVPALGALPPLLGSRRAVFRVAGR